MGYTWDKTVDQTLDAYQQIAKIPAGEVEKTVEVQMQSSTDLGNQGYDMAVGAEQFQETLERGELAARNKEYDLALNYLQRSLEMSPRSVRALKACGAVHLARNEIGRAQSYFSKALEIDPHDPRSLSGQGMCEMKQGSAQKAYTSYLRALEGEPYHMVTILQFIECCYVLRRYDDLVLVLDRYVQAHPQDLDMRYCLAGAFYKQEKFAEALHILEQVLSASPNHIAATELKTEISSKLGAVPAETPQPETVSQPEPVQEERPEQQLAQVTAEEVLYDKVDARLTELEECKRQREFDIVREECTELVTDQSTSAAQKEYAQALLAEVMLLEGDVAGAEAGFGDILRANPESVRAICGLGVLRASQGDTAQAVELFERAAQLEPESDVALAGLGFMAANNNEAEKAWDLYQRALKSNPENIRALLGLLEIGYLLKRYAEVEQAIKAYLDMHPGDLDFLYSLAGCYYVQGRLEEARQEVDKIVLFEPGHDKALELKELIESRAG